MTASALFVFFDFIVSPYILADTVFAVFDSFYKF